MLLDLRTPYRVGQKLRAAGGELFLSVDRGHSRLHATASVHAYRVGQGQVRGQDPGEVGQICHKTFLATATVGSLAGPRAIEALILEVAQLLSHPVPEAASEVVFLHP